jgi:hypothetical protein
MTFLTAKRRSSIAQLQQLIVYSNHATPCDPPINLMGRDVALSRQPDSVCQIYVGQRMAGDVADVVQPSLFGGKAPTYFAGRGAKGFDLNHFGPSTSSRGGEPEKMHFLENPD